MNSRLLAGAGIESRRALRGLVRAPGFSVGVVLVLGVAITGMVTVTTAAYDLFLRPLPFSHSEQLAHLTSYSRSMGFNVGFSPPMLAEVRQESMVADVAAYHEPSIVRSPAGDEWHTASVTQNLTGVLGVSPLLGRSFVPADAEPGGPPVALISESVWRNRFGTDESVIGREIVLAEKRIVVVGVLPSTFTVPTPTTDLWQPLRYTPKQLAPDSLFNLSGGDVVVRLKPGYTAVQFEHAVRARYAEDTRARLLSELVGLEFQVRGLREAWGAEQRQPLAISGLAALLVLAAALFNVTGLWLTRLLGTSHEQAIQAALGAGNLRRLGRTLIEFMVLGAAGACLALALTPFTLDWLKDLGALKLDQPLPIGSGSATIVITAIMVAASALPVLLAATWQQRRQCRDLIIDLSSGGHGSLNSNARTRRVLIVAQVALAMSLLCATGLLLRSWYGLLTEDLGFEPQNLLVARTHAVGNVDEAPVDADPQVAAALDELRGIPGVTEVAHTNVAPFAGTESIISIPVPGRDDRETAVRACNVSEHYFQTTGIPLLRGRSFEDGDASGGGVIVDEYFASLYFPPGGALGERIRIGDRDAVIVGVARTGKYYAPDEEPDKGTVYQFSPTPLPDSMLVIATRVPPATLIDAVQNVLERVVGPDRTGSVVAMEYLVRRAVRERESQLILLGLFGFENLALAGIGLFSLLAYSVHARTAEFAVRRAVGANSDDIRRHVLADAIRLLIPGLALGIAGAWLAGKVVASRLYGVSPVDPVTWTVTGLLLALVVMAAGLWPAARAARIEPTEALRYE